MDDDEYYAALYLRKFLHKDKLDEIKWIIKWNLFRPYPERPIQGHRSWKAPC
jgi:hypothetical protein